ncbi:MAG TPA: acyl-CoA dehydrogenase [Gammaproteobacteria bacterium]|nr:acyl-CoA dehydrogenase [Gammaproteobacteria bacterium]
MDFALDNMHLAAQQAAEKFALQYLSPLALEMDIADSFPQDIWQKLGAAHLLGAGLPEEFGGQGSDVISAALIGEALAYVSPAFSLSYGAHLNLCAHNLLRNGTEAQKKAYLPKLASGEWIGALAITEPNIGSDAMGMQCVAQQRDDGFIINGNKMFITNSPVADLLIFYAKTDTAAGKRGISAFLLELPAEGFSVSRRLDKVGMRGSPTGELRFDNVFVPRQNLLGKLNQGYKVVMSGLDIERAFLSTINLAVMRHCLEICIDYAALRHKQSTKPQQYDSLIADIYRWQRSTRLATYRALSLAQQQHRISKEAALAILTSSEKALRAAEQTLDLVQLMGFRSENVAQRLWRDAKLMVIGAGTSEIRRLLIARELLGQR